MLSEEPEPVTFETADMWGDEEVDFSEVLDKSFSSTAGNIHLYTLSALSF